MSYDRRHFLVNWGGTFLGGETWQCGIRFRPTAVYPDATWDAAWALISIDDIRDLFSDFWHSATMAFPAVHKFSWAKLSSVTTAGVIDREPKLSELGTPRAGNDTSAPYAGAQQAACITLWSGHTFGKANFGRFYLPSPNVQMDATTGVWAASECSTRLTVVETLLNDVQGEVGTVSADVSLAIMSKLGSGSYNDVAELRFGHVPDTQRRRRRSLAEAYSTVAYTP